MISLNLGKNRKGTRLKNLQKKGKNLKNPNEKKVILELPRKAKKIKIKDRDLEVLTEKKNRKNITNPENIEIDPYLLQKPLNPQKKKSRSIKY